MTQTKKIAAFIIILITSFPMVLIANNGPDALPNFIGMAYAWLYFKYSLRIAPKLIKDYIAYLDEETKRLDEEWD